MRRSIIIVLVLLALLGVGCSKETAPQSVTPAETPSQVTVLTQTPSQVMASVAEKPDLVIDSNMEFIMQSVYSVITVTGTVTNKSDFGVSGIELKLDLYDVDGKFIKAGICSLPKGTTLAAGGVWRYCYLGDDKGYNIHTQVLASLTVK